MLALALLAVGAGLARAEGPEGVVQRLEAALIDVMRGRAALDFEARYARLAPVVTAVLDVDHMGRVVLGAHWSTLAEPEREQFLTVFRELVIATFAGQVGEHAGEEFKLDEVKPLKRERMLVRSRFVEPDGDAARFDYVVHRVGDGWGIVNLVVDGVSDLALKRSEYAGVITREGFSALLDRIRGQVADYRTGG